MATVDTSLTAPLSVSPTTPPLLPAKAPVSARLLEHFKQFWARLNQAEQATLLVLAIGYHRFSRSAVVNCLKRLDIKSLDGKRPLNVGALETVFKRLEAAGLVTRQGDNVRIALQFAHYATLEAMERGYFESLVAAVRAESPYYPTWYSRDERAYQQCLGELRIPLYLEDYKTFATRLDDCYERYPEQVAATPPLPLLLAHPFDADWFSRLPDSLAMAALRMVLEDAFSGLHPVGEVLEYARRRLETDPTRDPTLSYLVAQSRLLDGDVTGARALLEPEPMQAGLALAAWADFLEGDNPRAIQRFTLALAQLRKATRKRKIFLQELPGVFHILALIRSSDPARLQEATGYLALVLENPGHPLFATYQALEQAVVYLQGDSEPVTHPGAGFWGPTIRYTALSNLFAALTMFWTAPKETPTALLALLELWARSEVAGYRWAAAEAAEMLGRLDEGTIPIARTLFKKVLEPSVAKSPGTPSSHTTSPGTTSPGTDSTPAESPAVKSSPGNGRSGHTTPAIPDSEKLDLSVLEASSALKLLEAGADGGNPFTARARTLREAGGFVTLVDLITPVEPWERALKALVDLGALHTRTGAIKAAPIAEKRLIWLVGFHEKSGSTSITPLEQKRDARGNWTKGRALALKRLYQERESLDYLSEVDKQALGTLEHDVRRSYGYAQEAFYFDTGRTLLALVGHPLVFWSDQPDVQVEVTAGEPELVVSESSRQVTMALEPPLEEGKDYLFRREGANRFKVLKVNDQHRRLAAILSEGGLKIPKKARERVMEAITAVAPLVNVQSDIGASTQLEEVAASSRPVMRIIPNGQGLRLELLAQPFDEKGPAYRPGEGRERVMAEIDGKRLQTRRDLKDERRRADALVATCPTLARLEPLDDIWTLEDPEECLEALLELNAQAGQSGQAEHAALAGQDGQSGQSGQAGQAGQIGHVGQAGQVRLEWPQGESLKVGREVRLDQLKVRVQREHDWFGASGGITLDDGQVLDMKELLDLLERRPGRFIPLGEGRFLALTRELRRRLDDLRGLSWRQGRNVRIHPLAAEAVQEALEGAGTLETDPAWQKQLERIQQAGTLQAELPSTLQAELRPYQLEGFHWLARLAHWGVGACLADDMGLGKTVQTLALLLRHAPDGPALVVAPTSVGSNWISEAQKFAPTLNPILLGTGDRKKVLEGLGPFDLLVCSYGLLLQEIDLLETVQFRTIVLDEAQAIKNVAARRSQAALKLNGDFKMACTGTPIENHLGELWNLFRFLNPGLLGSLEQFNTRFAAPIEKQQDRQARGQLKRLIQPFILRRTKNEVLRELPPRTEILMQVELSEEEAAFYEATRRKALENLEQSGGPAGQRQLRILAEIMRLRRAASNPRMVMPETSIQSSKLSELGDILDELLENRHKALIFSQFVDHLTLLREYLDERRVAYQYLDGSTPGPERKKRVDAFQAGVGDVFLISLKAGGLGLNLTAADYVIHMDPWWNPAVEDQASDRAHRIGQSRPVTIYRLVAKGTIEEKIVSMHHQKRDLADSLLEGADLSARLSEEELLGLLRG